MRSLVFWLLGFVCGFFIGGMVEDANARYRPVAAVQDEAAISCGTLGSRQRALEVARDLGATRIRINAIQNMNPVFGCDPVAAARAAAAAGFSVHITLQGTLGWARYIDRAIGPLVQVWSTWNEPNHSDFHFGPMAGAKPRTYRKLHIGVARTLRKVDPGSSVLVGELAPNTVHESKWLGKVVHSRKRPLYADGIAVHAYVWFGDPDSADERGMRGYLRAWKAVARTWARERRLCRSAGVGERRSGGRCRPVPIYVTEAGYMRELEVLWGAPVYDTPTTADRLVRSWRVACQEKVRQMFHYQLMVAHQPRWDTSLIGDHGPRPEFSVLKGYLATAQGCRGTRGPLGQEHGPPPVPVVPPADHVPVQISPPLPPLPPGVPVDVPVVVEPDVVVPEVEPTPPVAELSGPPEPVADPPAEPVVPPIEEETP